MTELKDLRHQRNPRALNPPDRTGLRNLCESVQSVGLKKNKLLIRVATSVERYCNEEPNITFFKKLIGVTTCNIVGTLYW